MKTFKEFIELNEAKQLTINLDTFYSKAELSDVAKDAKRRYNVIFKNIKDGEFDVTGKKEDIVKYLTDKDGYDMAMYDAEEVFPELF